LVNDHDPRHLHEEFVADHRGSFGWEYLSREPRDWRIRISKLTGAPLPRLLVNTAHLPGDADAAGAVWKLQARERDVDCNVIALAPDGRIEAHDGPDLDVLIHVIAGTGTLSTELDGRLELVAGDLVWLPRRSRRAFTAGPGGLRYLTVHQRRQALVLTGGPVGVAR
jgi:quercetin dioxygenase-like cupin family protein